MVSDLGISQHYLWSVSILCHIDTPWLLPRAAKAFYKALAAGKGVVDSHSIAQSSVRHSANVGIRHEAVPRTSDDVAEFSSWRL